MKDIIIFPFGGNAKEAVTVIENINKVNKQWNIIGFLDDNKDLWGKTFAGYRVLGPKEEINNYKKCYILSVPGSPSNYHRRDYVINLLNISIERYATLIDPSVTIGQEVSIGYNTLIMSGVIITANVEIGNHCIILPNTVISHDSVVKDYTCIGSNVSVSGNVTIEKKCYIGTGSKLIQDITIAENTLVGIGSVVLKSTQPSDVVVGNPAKVLKKQDI